jgi:hypothetical protein
MKDSNSKIQRLLRAAAQVPDLESPELPLGFETRVVALWRSGNGSLGANGIMRLVRRVAIVAGCVIVISGAASLRELYQTRDIFEPGSNEFAIADSAIQNEFDQ